MGYIFRYAEAAALRNYGLPVDMVKRPPGAAGVAAAARQTGNNIHDMIHCGIDVGHASGTGARSACGRYDEHELNAKLAGVIARKLRGRGIRVTVYDFPALNNRADLNRTISTVNADGVDFLVSLHSDCAQRVVRYETCYDEDGIKYQRPIPEDDPRARGAHVCYVSAAGCRLARCIARYLVALLPGRADSTVQRKDLAILNRTKCVAVLGENGFVTSPSDMEIVTERMEEIADAYVNGILDYLLP